jgi:hypothetical protein
VLNIEAVKAEPKKEKEIASALICESNVRRRLWSAAALLPLLRS